MSKSPYMHLGIGVDLDHTLTTPEQAKEFTHYGKRRAIAKDDCTYELAPLAEIHERMGHAEPSQP